ncbi:MAG: YkgJ family cysteine cluster protein [Myxococcota bacterium]
MFDCVACGACCFNTRDNIEQGYVDYVEIDDSKSKLLRDKSLRRKFVVEDAQGRPHLRLLQDRCAALKGALGKTVRCAVYAHRPKPCRRVQPGDRDCLRSRAERGL